MKIKRTETHDRLQQFSKQADYISQGCEECIRNRPQEFESLPFYIFSHKREIGIDERRSMYNLDFYDSLTHENYQKKYTSLEDVPTARLIWEPRLTKPLPQENSMLFKAYPGTDNIKIVWMIPSKELWPQYKKGNLTEHQIVCESIYDFENNPRKLSASEDDDLPDEKINAIYEQMSINARRRKGFLGIFTP